MRTMTVLLVASLCVPCAARAERALGLAQAVDIARARRPEMAQAELDIRLARLGLLDAALQRVRLTVDGRFTEQAQRLYINAPPDLCASIYGLCQTDNHARLLDLSASLVVPLWSGMGLEAQWARARELERAAQAGKGSRLRTLALEVASAYWTVRWAELLGKAAETALGRRTEVAATIRARSEAGITPRGDLNRADSAVLRQQAAVMDLEGRATQARADLAAALQLDDDLVLTDEPLAGGTALPPLSQALAQAERRRPELAHADAQVAAQQQQVRVLKGALWPQVSLFARADAENHVFGVPQPRLIGNLSGGLLVSWLAFDSLTGFQAARGATLEADKLAAERERTRALVRAEVRASHSRLATAVARRQPLTRALGLAESTLGLIRRRHQTGAALFIEVLDAENELEELTASVIGNSIEIAQARAVLTAATGGP